MSARRLDTFKWTPRLGAVELNVVVTILDLLFLAFVIVQFRYLFGGRDLVQQSANLTYAEYARHGFFELVAVAALTLPLLLLGDWLLREEGAGAPYLQVARRHAAGVARRRDSFRATAHAALSRSPHAISHRADWHKNGRPVQRVFLEKGLLVSRHISLGGGWRPTHKKSG